MVLLGRRGRGRRPTYNLKSVPDPIRQEAFRFAGAFRAGLPELFSVRREFYNPNLFSGTGI